MDFLIALLFGIFISYLEDKEAQEDWNDNSNIGMPRSDNFRLLVYAGIFIGFLCAYEQTKFFAIGYFGYNFTTLAWEKIVKIRRKGKK